VEVSISRSEGSLAESFACLACLAACTSCEKLPLSGTLLPNQPPTVVLSQVPAASEVTGTYAYELSWAGFDTDGIVETFHYAVDPPSADLAETTWVRTAANRRTFVFRSDSLDSGSAVFAHGYHTIVVRAQDDRGAVSLPAIASFSSRTVAPTVTITSPSPHKLLARQVGTTARIDWVGDDPDGLGTREPNHYRWKLFGPSTEVTASFALGNPDSVRRRYAPSFASWDSVGAETPSVVLRDLLFGQNYVIAVVALDGAGAYSPVFSLDRNMLWFQPNPNAFSGPIISLSSASFSYTYPTGGYFLDQDSRLRLEFPADVPIPIHWSAKTVSGGFIRGFRWAIDLKAIDDETARSNEETDLQHWSRVTTSDGVLLPRFLPTGGFAETHTFYLEAEDDQRLKSLAVVEFTIVRPSFDRDLLIIDDTWLTPDRVGTGGCVRAPTGEWPTAAELDTFLYAVGGKPYRCLAAGTQSPVGVFAGYSFDTLGTHFSLSSSVGLQRLGRYRNVIWMTDANSAYAHTEPYNTTSRPQPLLRAWNGLAVQNPLAVWVLLGGRLWLTGGGTAMASLKAYDRQGSADNIFSADLGELRLGQMMYDNAGWRSEIRILKSIQATRSPRALGGWAGAPDYTLLPDLLMGRSTATDPVPAGRSSASYASTYTAEHLVKPNSVFERLHVEGPQVSVLDTLYETIGGTAGPGWPVMTLYHESQRPITVFSGFPFWYFQRDQVIALVDFVLGQVWGLRRQSIPR